MTSELPAPLVPIDVDLRGYDFMPFYGHRLFGSDFNARASDAGWRAAVTLWWAAWNQVPAGSLPNNDVALCRLADLGRDLKAFGKLKADALHGFVECGDGRLYHRAMAEWVLEAWDKRVKDRERKAKFRAARRGHEPGQDADGTRTERGQPVGHERSGTVEREAKRSDSEVRELQNRDVGVDPPSVASRPADKPANPAVEKIESRKANGKADAAGQNWEDEAYVAASAANLDVPRRSNESFVDWRDRVYTRAQSLRQGARH